MVVFLKTGQKRLKIYTYFDLRRGVNVTSSGVFGDLCTPKFFFLNTLSEFHEIWPKIAKYTRISTEKERLT